MTGRVFPLLALAALAAGTAWAEESGTGSAGGDPDTPVLQTEWMTEAAREDAPASSRPVRNASDDGTGRPGRGAWHPGELYLGLLGGNVEAGDTTVNGTYQCYFCAPVSDSASTSLGGGGMFGMRGGFWGSSGSVNPGLAFEASGGGVSGDRVSLHYQGFGILPMVRMPLLRSVAHPEGRLAPYAGVLLFGLQGGSMEANLPALPRPLSGTPKGRANGMLLGLAVRLGTVELAVEARKVSVDVSLDSMAGDKADFRADTTQMLLVINYRFSQ